MSSVNDIIVTLTIGVATMMVVGGGALAEESDHLHSTRAPVQEQPKPPIRITAEELHRHGGGGVPPGWQFTFPAGDPKAGRTIFAKLECYKCHTIKGEQFSSAARQPDNAGPELTGMGSHHPAEYFAESILNPNAVIVTGPGYTGPDGLSIMPDNRNNLSAGELIDLVAYLKSLSSGAAHGEADGGGAREQVVGEYRVRIEYQPVAGSGHAHGSASGHSHSGQAQGHLVVLISDAQTGEPVAYLPVTATIMRAAKPSQVIELIPMVGPRGFHYGADVSLPEDTTKIRLALGPTRVRVMAAAGARYGKRQEVSFDWPGQAQGHH